MDKEQERVLRDALGDYVAASTEFALASRDRARRDAGDDDDGDDDDGSDAAKARAAMVDKLTNSWKKPRGGPAEPDKSNAALAAATRVAYEQTATEALEQFTEALAQAATGPDDFLENAATSKSAFEARVKAGRR